MKGNFFLKHSKEWIQVSDTPFAGGGEGNLYHILSPAKYRKKYVAKVYHTHKLTEERAEKMDYLSTYSPLSEQEQKEGGHAPVIWCTDILLETGNFVGFIMPYTEGEKLEILTTPKIPRKKRQIWKRFDFKAGKSALTYRMKLGFNLCAAIHQVHKIGRYVLVDMKPDNIIIQTNGLVAIVDTDSVEVVEDNKTLFDAPVATPEYTPPEHYKTLSYDPTQRQEWDLFGLGVILYKLLLGIHPFAASTVAPYEHLTTLEQKVENGFFVHHPQHAHSFSTIPPPHQAFYQLDEGVQDLFMRCFVDGQEQPELRPTAEEWCVALLVATDDQAANARYGHILKKKRGYHRMYMTLPSNKFTLPTIQQELTLLQLLNEQEQPRLAPPFLQPQDYIHFSDANKVQKLSNFIPLAVFLAIGTAISGSWLGFFFILSVGLGIHKNRRPESKMLEKEQARLRQVNRKYEHIKRRIAKEKTYLSRRLGNVVDQMRENIQLLNEEIQAFDVFLKAQDEKVKALNEKANNNYKLIHDEFLQQAKSNRVIARIETEQYQSLLQLKTALQIEQKKAVNELSRQHGLGQNQQERIAIEDLFAQKRTQLEIQQEETRKKMKVSQSDSLNQLYQKLEEEADFGKNWLRLWNGLHRNSSSEKVLSQRFQEAHMQSMLQIAKIDVNASAIELNNGQKVLVNGISASKQILRNMLYWMDELRHQKGQIAAEEHKIDQSMKDSLNSLERQERLELAKLEQLKQQQLEKIKVLVPVEQLGAPYQKLQQHYENANHYIEELEAAQEQEASSVTNQYQMQYEEIMAKSEAKLMAVEARIAPLQQALKRDKQKFQHKRVQQRLREIQAYQQKMDVATEELKQSMKKVKQYSKINYINYIKYLFRLK